MICFIERRWRFYLFYFIIIICFTSNSSQRLSRSICSWLSTLFLFSYLLDLFFIRSLHTRHRYFIVTLNLNLILKYGCIVRSIRCHGRTGECENACAAELVAVVAGGEASAEHLRADAPGNGRRPPGTPQIGKSRISPNFVEPLAATSVPLIRQSLRFSGISCHWVQKIRNMREIPTIFYWNW